jgi:hypothetical protein
MKKNGLYSNSQMTSRGGPTLALILIAIIALWISALPVLAGTIAFGSGTNASLKGLCDKHGGAYTENEDGGSTCSGKGGSITCTGKGKCTGQCETCGDPAVKHKPITILGVIPGTILKKVGTTSPSVHGRGSSHNPIVENSKMPDREVSQDHSSKKK